MLQSHGAEDSCAEGGGDAAGGEPALAAAAGPLALALPTLAMARALQRSGDFDRVQARPPPDEGHERL